MLGRHQKRLSRRHAPPYRAARSRSGHQPQQSPGGLVARRGGRVGWAELVEVRLEQDGERSTIATWR